MIDILIGEPLNWSGDVEIDAILKDIEVIKNLGATHVSIEAEFGTKFDVRAIQIRLETEDEVNLRLLKKKQRDDERRASELALLEILKKKYEA